MMYSSKIQARFQQKEIVEPGDGSTYGTFINIVINSFSKTWSVTLF